ncbi:MAG: dTDP-4-dehydrorhamnose reductase [Thermoanaerobaculia bacterium]
MGNYLKVLIPGGRGMLGYAVCEYFSGKRQDFKVLDLPEFDVTQKDRVGEEIEKYKPTIILNLSAYTKVDQAEVEKDKAFEVNEKGVENLCFFCSKFNIKLIHISTDYVFNGKKEGEWSEEDKPEPINIYGLSKLKGEEKVKNLKDFLIIRTSWLFGPNGQNFVKTISEKLKKGENLKVVKDQRGCPTYTKVLAEAIYLMIEKNAKGIYHFCQPPPTTWYDFAIRIREVLALKNKIEPVSSEEYKTLAKRPKNSVLSIKKFLREFDFSIPNWEESLFEYLKNIMNYEK